MEIDAVEKTLRHGKMIGFRDDLTPKDCTWDKYFGDEKYLDYAAKAAEYAMTKLVNKNGIIDKKAIAKFTEEAAEKYDIRPRDCVDRAAGTLSGGNQQKAIIAREIDKTGVKLLVFDEPTAVLTESEATQLISVMKKIAESGIAIIFITHNLGVVAEICDKVSVMYAGKIVEYGTADDVFYDPKHPYTWALLSSLPQLGVKNEPLYSIQGTPPNLFREVKGDAFAPRNPNALKIDFEERPPYFEVSPTHKAKTWLLDERAPKVEKPEIIQNIHEKLVDSFNI